MTPAQAFLPSHHLSEIGSFSDATPTVDVDSRDASMPPHELIEPQHLSTREILVVAGALRPPATEAFLAKLALLEGQVFVA